MKKQKNENEINLDYYIDKYLIAVELQILAEGSNEIAKYIDQTVHYGRALGYAEGRTAAFNEIHKRIIRSEFDFDPEVRADE
jgi:hypothetical protein